MAPSREDVLQFTDLLLRVNEQVKCREQVENEHEVFDWLEQIAQELLDGLKPADALGAAVNREILQLAKDLPKLDYASCRDRLTQLTNQLQGKPAASESV